MRRCLASAILLAAAIPAARAQLPLPSVAPSPANVVVVANSSDPDSLAIAGHYARARGVPRGNVLALPMPLAETIAWRDFVASIWQPLQDELVRGKWIEASAATGTDAVGRRNLFIAGHRIAALVVCRGVPLRIDNDPTLYASAPPMTDVADFRTNAGAVDSELSLIAMPGGYNINAYVANPLFEREMPSRLEKDRVVEVSRLDGPTAAEAMGLVDLALEAERTGLLGRAYVDMAGEYVDGNRWLGQTAALLERAGFDTSVQKDRETMAPYERFDAPALYFGWHTPDLNGPFALPGFRFPPGAVALHIHSFSARTMRSATESWCGPLVARGVTATMGNVFEPFLQLTHRPDLLFRALYRGDTLADAAYYALPVLSWQSILIGDPLYRPFAIPLKEQLRRLDDLPSHLAGYPVLRMMHLLDLAGQPGKALDAGRAALKERPSLALDVEMARRLEAAGKADEAAGFLKPTEAREPLAPDRWDLAREAASLLVAAGRPGDAVAVYRRIFADAALPVELRARWLVEARQAALAANDAEQGAAWKAALDGAVEQMLKKP